MTYRSDIIEFAASTLDATAWIIAHAPERLHAWLANHAYGPELERQTRRAMAQRAKQREEAKRRVAESGAA